MEKQPVTNETVEPKLRKRKLVPKQANATALKYNLWLAGHVSCVVFGLLTCVWQAFWLKDIYYINSISYRLTLIGSVIALVSTVSHKFGLRNLPHFPMLVAQLNFQFLVLAIIWIFTFKSIFKIIPYLLVSVLQLTAHKKIGAVQKQAEFLASVIAFDELILAVYLILRTLLFKQTAGYQLAVVLIFFWLRVLFDDDTANMFAFVVNKLDGRVQTIKNKQALNVWDHIKDFLEEKRQPGLEHPEKK